MNKNISELKDGDRGFYIELDIVEIYNQSRVVNGTQVITAKVKDATGECNLDIWGESNIKLLQKDTKIRLSNGMFKLKEYINKETNEKKVYRNITNGKFGKIEVLIWNSKKNISYISYIYVMLFF